MGKWLPLMNYGGMWKGAVAAYFKALSQYLPVRTEVGRGKYVRI
jgi:hypothetical protein